MMNNFNETLFDSYGQEFRIDELLFESKTDHQHLIIFHNAVFGRVMVLDGIVQTTERDEFIYHEMLTHVPLLAHGRAEKVLIIGGGDGGMLREVLKHQRVVNVTQVEIDQQVVDLCKTHLPNHSRGAFEDPRLNLVIGDGLRYVAETDETFDVIISDSTDPIGPGEVLFSDTFYKNCRRCLKPGGVLVTQNGVPFMQPEEVENTAKLFRKHFADWHFYTAAIPTYVGGAMAFGWATDNRALRRVSPKELNLRFLSAGIQTRYYNTAIHGAAFALPQYILETIGKKNNE